MSNGRLIRDEDGPCFYFPWPTERQPFISFSWGLTGYRNVPGKGWYRFAYPFIYCGRIQGGRGRTLRLGVWLRPCPEDAA